MGFLGLFCWFLIEKAIPTSDSLFGWPAWRGFVSGKPENKEKRCSVGRNMWVWKPLRALGVPQCVGHVHGGAPLLKAQTKESPAPVPLVSCLNSNLLWYPFSCGQLNQSFLGIRELSLDLLIGVSAVSSRKSVSKPWGSGIPEEVRSSIAHLPLSFLFQSQMMKVEPM